jgi:hypothetical protein
MIGLCCSKVPLPRGGFIIVHIVKFEGGPVFANNNFYDLRVRMPVLWSRQTVTLCRVLAVVLLVALVPQHSLFAQQSDPADSELRGFSRRFFQEERDLWTSPLRLHQEDMKWLLPLGLGTAGFVLIDRQVRR